MCGSIHCGMRDVLDDGWDLLWRPTGFDELIYVEARLIVLDPSTVDWVAAVDEAIGHVQELHGHSRHLRLARDDEE